MTETIRTDWPDIWYTAFHEVEGETGVNFRIHEIDSFAIEADGNLTPVFDEDNKPLMVGRVKWDGCSDWNTPQGANVHFCTRDGAQKLGTAMERCWDIAAAVFPRMTQ